MGKADPSSRGQRTPPVPSRSAAFDVHGPLSGQSAAAEGILRALPGWFGIEAALVDYARAADAGPTFFAEAGGVSIGFATLRATSECAVELHVIAVLPEWHRHGVGGALLEHTEAYALGKGFEILHVKTLAPCDPDPGYAATRAFYLAWGFQPLEVLPQVWGPENPCLLLVKSL